MSGKRAWILCSNRWNSAITEYALRSAQALQRQGWSVAFSPLAESPGAKRAIQMGLFGPSFEDFGPAAWPKFMRELRQIQPSTILLFGGPETFLSRGAASAIPKVRFRGQDSDVAGDLSAWRTRFGLSHCSAILTPGTLLQKRFQSVLEPKPVWSVVLGLDAQEFAFRKDALRQIFRPTMRMVGRLDPIKGHRVFFQIYAEMLKIWPKDVPSPFLEVIGQPANISIETLKTFAAENGLRESADWSLCAERVSDLPARLRSTHLGVVPSLGSEVICRVSEEFLLSGCPLFVSPAGTLSECIFSSLAGVSYGDESPRALAELLKKQLLSAFLEDESYRFLRSEEACKLFSLERMGQDLDRCLSSLL